MMVKIYKWTNQREALKKVRVYGELRNKPMIVVCVTPPQVDSHIAARHFRPNVYTSTQLYFDP